MSFNLTHQDDLKLLYLKNLGMEYKFGCYMEKESDMCHLLGDYLENVEEDFKKASVVYKENCDHYKYGKSCYKYAVNLFLGRGVPKVDYATAYKYFEKGCNLKNPESCLEQGLLLTGASDAKNNKIVTDMRKGMELLEKSCLGETDKACDFVSTMYLNGVTHRKSSKGGNGKETYLVARDMSKAFAFAYKGCELENASCCASVSEMYRRGNGVEKNLELAEKYKKITLNIEEQMNSKQTLTYFV